MSKRYNGLCLYATESNNKCLSEGYNHDAHEFN